MKLKAMVLAWLSIVGFAARTAPLPDGSNYTEKVGDYTWTFSIVDGEARIGTGNMTRAVDPNTSEALTVPATLGGCPVVALNGYAFIWCNMSAVTLPNTLREIGDYAFNYSSVTRINISASVEMISKYAFDRCSYLRKLTVAVDNPWFSSEDGVLYDKNKETIYFWPVKKRIEIPSGVKNIWDHAFERNTASQNKSVTIPSSVTNIGLCAFADCKLRGVNLNEGLVSIGGSALTGNDFKSIIMPSTVRQIDWYVFESCNELVAVHFSGNAPENPHYLWGSYGSRVYNGTRIDLMTFIRPGSTGWKAVGSAELPDAWPVPNEFGDVGEQRPIREWTTYPDVGWMVRFDLGEYGVRTGGGELEQLVADGTAAVAPKVTSSDDECAFAGWDRDFSQITETAVVNAVYVKSGLKLIGDVNTSIRTPWSPVATIDYSVVGDAGGKDVDLRLEYLSGGAWHPVSSRAISGVLSGDLGWHAISFSFADLGLDGREVTFRFVAREKGTAGVEVFNTDGWTVENGAWRCRRISHNEQTSLFATTFGEGELTFDWKASTESVSYDWLEWFVDGESQGKIGGDSAEDEAWTKQSIALLDGDEHQIEWRYRKDGSVSGGQDCGWVANVEMGGGASLSETPFAIEVPAPEIALNVRLTENGQVVLEADDPQATIYITTSGENPTAESERYAGPVNWPAFRRMKAVALEGSEKWSGVVSGKDFVRIFLDPALGVIGTNAVIRRVGDEYGALPVPVRDGSEFLGWTKSESDMLGQYAISSDDIVPADGVTLFASWDITPKRIVDPKGLFGSVSSDWDNWNCSRTSNTSGYWDEEEGTWVETNRVWREYVYTSGRVGPTSSNVFLSATFSGPGVLNFGYFSGNEEGLLFCVDGVRRELVRDLDSYNEYSMKILSAGNHLLELVAVCDSDWATYCSCSIGGMSWTNARSRIAVEFDARGGEVNANARQYRAGYVYGEFPALSVRPGYEFLGWFTDPVGGVQKTETDFVDFEVQRLYAHWRTDLATALNTTSLQFVSSGPTGWDGQSGVSHDGIASAASGWLEWNETNTLATTVIGKGVLSFWWKTENARGVYGDDCPFDMQLMLEVDGRTMKLRNYGEVSANANGWLKFSLSLTNAYAHAIKWRASVDSTVYNEWASDGYSSSAREELEYYLGELVSEPGAWVDEVEWLPDADQTDVVQWGHSAYQARRILPGKADPMIAWCNQRILANPNDYEAHVRRAITRIKELSENPVFRSLLGRYGLAFSDELMAITGTFSVDNAPLSNDAIDMLAEEVMPTLNLILEDLDIIPKGWRGTVALSASQYPVDEDVYIDYADVVMARSCVHGAKATVFAAQGYDLTVENQKMYEEVVVASNRKAIVVSEFTGDWDACQVGRMKSFGDDGWVRVAAQGKKLLVRITLPENLSEDCAMAESSELELEFSRETEDDYEKLWVSFDLTGDGADVSGWWSGHIGGEWLSEDLSSVVVSKKEAGLTVELELDFSGIEDFGRAAGFEMNDASIWWWTSEGDFSISSDCKEYLPELTAEAILAAHPQFASAIRDQAALTASKVEVRTALELYGAFDAAIRDRTSGKMHFFEFDPNYAEQWAAVAKSAQLAKTALDEVVAVKGLDYACFERFKQTNLNERVTLAPLFDGKILRSLLPPFEGDRPVLSSIPDIRFAGTFPDWTMENRRTLLKKIDGIWYDDAFPPVISVPTSFDGPFAEVVITDRSPNARMFYTTDGSDPVENGKEYVGPFKVFATTLIRAVAVTKEFGVSAEALATVEKIFGIGDSIGSYDAKVSNGSDVPWTVDMSVAHNGGEASMRSGCITSSDDYPERNYSTMSATYCGRGTLSFWWKVSCEEDGISDATYDFLGVYVNGLLKKAIDGEVGWTKVELVFSDVGEHRIEWKYSKDDLDDENVGEDCGWIDDVVWIPEEVSGVLPGETMSTCPPVSYDWIDKHGLGPRHANGGETFEQAAKMPSPTGKRDANGNVLSVLDEYVAGTDPQKENDTFHAEIRFEDGKAVIEWYPKLPPEEAAKRVYRTFGRELLGSGEWIELIGGNTDGFNFFKTSVEWK